MGGQPLLAAADKEVWTSRLPSAGWQAFIHRERSAGRLAARGGDGGERGVISRVLPPSSKQIKRSCRSPAGSHWCPSLVRGGQRCCLAPDRGCQLSAFSSPLPAGGEFNPPASSPHTLGLLLMFPLISLPNRFAPQQFQEGLLPLSAPHPPSQPQ